MLLFRNLIAALSVKLTCKFLNILLVEKSKTIARATLYTENPKKKRKNIVQLMVNNLIPNFKNSQILSSS